MTEPVRIAIVGVAAKYPDANDHEELWRNALAGRRAFRRLPDVRMRREDYWDPDPTAPDRFYSEKAAVLEGFEFDRVKYKIAGSTFRSTDMTHWLALETASRALADAGFPEGQGLDGEKTGVVIGNTLTGEFSRANLMRLRWPYVKRTVGAALREAGWDDDKLGLFLGELEQRYKSPFPPIDEDTLAGGLANTIAGRVCNYFDFKGGGFTVDGACSSSLLSVITASNALANGQIDAAIAGGVDLSIDPFEVIGFAKTGALATGEMKVYDKGSNGFWPGEGCGMLVLMRDEDAVERGLFRYATIAGWGYSSDGKGGITRPEADGHRLAIRRAYERAGFSFDTVRYIEGHGTGTEVGDATELKAFTAERNSVDPEVNSPAAISTIKGNIGHTKGAAGVAGLIKAVLAVRHQVIPPATGHFETHPVLSGERPALRVLNQAELWPEGAPIRAAVSSMGFGGINAHIVVEHADGARREKIGKVTQRLVRGRQDNEVLFVDAASIDELRGKAATLAEFTAQISYAELTDLAATLQKELGGGRVRAAVVARSPEQAVQRFTKLLDLLDGGARSAADTRNGVYFGITGAAAPRIGFLFPGQGAGRSADGGAIRRRFTEVEELYRSHPQPEGDMVDTTNAQPRIATGSAAGLRVLSRLGIEGTGAVGHSLGEISALHWAGAMDEDTLLRTAAARGRIMGSASEGGGTMAGVAAGPEQVEPLLTDEPVVIAGFNGPRQTVISGPVAAVARVSRKATDKGLTVSQIAVSHAFHSEGVAPASAELRTYLDGEEFTPLERTVSSTVTGTALAADTDVRDLLERQVVQPVRFTEALTELANEVDLLVEVGPGHILRGLAAEIAPDLPAVAMETDSNSLAGTLHTVAAAYAMGAPVRTEELFAERFVKPLSLDKVFKFLESPAEQAPEGEFLSVALPAAETAAAAALPAAGTGESTLSILLRLAAERAELPIEAVSPDSNAIDELHLSSITVGQILAQTSREIGVSAPLATSATATSTLAELAAMLDELAATETAADAAPSLTAPGVGPWVRAFAVDHVPAEPAPAAESATGTWELFSTERHPVAEELLAELQRTPVGDGVLLALPEDTDEEHTALMLSAVRAALANPQARFVAVGYRRGPAGIAKTLHLEAPATVTTIVTLPSTGDLTPEQAQEWAKRISADVAGTTSFSEVFYDSEGARSVPVLRALPPATAPAAGQSPLGPGDVLLVTGGGKGITAECALSLAQTSGASLALLGRSEAAKDPELAMNLERIRAAGVNFAYLRADVTNADEVKAAVSQAREQLGPITAVLHGAGRNEPMGLAALDESSFRRTLAPKIGGLEAVLAATEPTDLKLLITFASIIGRAGLRGEGDYATANSWLTDMTERLQEQYPDTKCLALEWSVWSGAGMGERLGVLESLMRDGIAPISPEHGIAVLDQLLADPNAPTSVVVMGRAEGLPTLAMPEQELPLLRFIERPQVHYPGVELVVEADLSADADPYLSDHLLDGDLLFPAVLGMEAMSQAARALTGREEAPTLRDMEFLRPIVAPIGGSTTIRIAVLADDENTVRAVIRSSDTGFQADHFTATLSYDAPVPEDVIAVDAEAEVVSLPVDPHTDLYGPVLFQGGRFQRLVGYQMLQAKGTVADISNTSTAPWFGTFHFGDLVLADPGTRDAMMHSLQCCVPDATLLPSGVEELRLADPTVSRGLDKVVLHAAERWRDGDTYMYDLDVRTEDGRLVERWTGLRLQAVRKLDGSGPWVPSLLGPYLQRRTEEILPVELRVGVHPDTDGPAEGVPARRAYAAVAVRTALGTDAVVRYRPDGKPETDEARISVSHGAGQTIAVGADLPVGVDMETVVERSEEDWQGLLGEQFALAQLLAEENSEDFHTAATRVWGAVECLRKTGHARIELAAGTPRPDRWVLLRSGRATVATFVTTVRGTAEPVVFALSTEGSE
ncbi:type I polyketide synthase [Actinacidiphila acididurans]|uniref:SDR family NAD(P)-dependent oxidoreductase n=1 Tax=Actinacidiphila acididurans TaxID=2784346 RepID=A0ABS2TZ51_9ACTN|nr:type I polyketide synthase [Actinacidiphila acididurans]MBM9508605.1 SDR family NAD(P)-dependent oxidoreductase [Actinacidiphila acididurans]